MTDIKQALCLETKGEVYVKICCSKQRQVKNHLELLSMLCKYSFKYILKGKSELLHLHFEHVNFKRKHIIDNTVYIPCGAGLLSFY